MTVQVFQQEAVIAAPEVTPVPFNASGPAEFPYPLPRLQISGPFQERTVSVVVLDNGRTRLALCPDLGGRVVEWSSQGLSLPRQMDLTAGGDQGLEWQHGIVWRPVGGARADLGPVQAELRPSPEDGTPAGVVLSGLTEDGAYLWRIALALGPDDDAPRVEGQISQLGFQPTRFESGWHFYGGAGWTGTQVGFPGRRCTWVQNLVAPTESEVLDLVWPDFLPTSSSASLAKASALVGLGQSSHTPTSPLLEAWSERIAAESAVIDRDWGRVVEEVESALEFNARDHRLWWLRSVASRKLREDDGGALANAIYLWPEDPLLKAESVVASDPGDTTAPHPMVERMKGDPMAMVEPAVQFCRLRLDDELSRWVHECLKVREVPMLRYLLGYALLTRSRFEAQAAEHVVLAGRQPLAPPFPARPYERLALSALASRFQSDKRLPVLLGLLGDEDRPHVSG